MAYAERNKLQNEIKDLNKKLKETEISKNTIHNQNLITIRKLQKLMDETKKTKNFEDIEKLIKKTKN